MRQRGVARSSPCHLRDAFALQLVVAQRQPDELRALCQSRRDVLPALDAQPVEPYLIYAEN